MDPLSETPAAIEFGRFRVLPHRRELLADSRQIQLGGRAFDVLMALIEASGAVVSKETLIARVWPNQIVEEDNLRVQISTLRNAFGANRDLIRTVAGRGYQFTGEIQALSTGANGDTIAGLAAAEPVLTSPPTNLQQSVSELIGRDVELQEILSLAAAHRLVTLTGAGGIGKTRLAREAARHLLPKFADGVWIAELAPLSDPGLVPVIVAEVVGLKLAAGPVSSERVANALGSKQFMLVLDNCEHLADAATRMAETMLRANPVARVITTSREPLRAEGEWTYLVPPLAVPAGGTEDVDDLLRYGAVWLFVARARATDPNFRPDRRAAVVIAAICRRLDGIPLAIELAASRAAALGIEELSARLDDRFHLLTGGRRTALPRQQTLRATLDWSYDLLAEPERVVLRRLAILAGGFGLEEANAIAASAEIAASGVVDSLANLVAKSLITSDVAGAIVRYRLLDTTRAYALEKLTESREFEQVARRHAEYHRDLFERAEVQWEARPTVEWLADYSRRVDHVRAALDWAFSPSGDASIAVALTAASVPLWMHLSLLEECRRRTERALAALEHVTSIEPRQHMQLLTAWGAALMLTKGPGPEAAAAWTRALEIAERLDDADYRLRALWGLFVGRFTAGRYRDALALAERFRIIAADSADPTEALIGERMMGVALHILGDQSKALAHLGHVLSRYVAPVRRSHFIRFQFDQRVAARSFYSRILWLQGFADQAMRTVEETIGEARTINHPTSLFYGLLEAACPVALLAGELTTAERFVKMLLDLAVEQAMEPWNVCGQAFRGVLLMKRGKPAAGLQLLRTALAGLPETAFNFHYTAFLADSADALARLGDAAKGLAIIDEALARSQHNEEHWCIADLLRIKGELILLDGASGAAAAAEDHLRQAVDWARRQNALSWELRAATSLARLWHERGRTIEARALLMPVYDRFTEGFGTADLEAARALIDDLS
jgi:predicted ATPase/DNA-binding winged helix-turn-helix (wHTH) protein